jgi:quaternary ammonium compound-resistance protein SugE
MIVSEPAKIACLLPCRKRWSASRQLDFWPTSQGWRLVRWDRRKPLDVKGFLRFRGRRWKAAKPAKIAVLLTHATAWRNNAEGHGTGLHVHALRTPPTGIDTARIGGHLAMAWIVLLVAGLLEVGWAIGLKFTDGFTRLWPSVGTVAAAVLSIVLLEWVVRTLPVGTAYAVWTGIGACGTALLGMYLFGEPATAVRLACIGMVVAGIVGLQLAS